ncbi:siderophore biosynthesis protein SbnG (plasmid) [Rhodococcus oxybenzonivorans]|uniref:Siderophore biosynthesis protein SbnG n=1 Tax=Rhodococcus oxybenzonivorans TaxID=1990687 RepID=A0A2S2C7I4_9NOCA|nr:aldolase/citrate lyase family protein [Rhodococcus oxybenzonivorans]AWK76748.1 siderophore biosynthesis protein SbnG [Rhodococcus oxybenzonivorans]
MLRPNAVKHALTASREVYGLYCSTPDPVPVEMIGCTGYDFVILDTEHTLVDPQQLETLIRAAEAVELTPFVRVPEADPGAVLRALDAGAMGIVVPHVRNRHSVDEAIRAARYHPEGMRSLGGGRVTGFGRIDPAEFIRRANAEIMVIALIEDAEGVEAIDEILTGGGIDLVLPGPGDLSQSYGVPWQTRHPLVTAAVERIHRSCVEHRVPFAAMARTPENHARWRSEGVTAFVLGEERDLAAQALRRHLDVVTGSGPGERATPPPAMVSIP